MTHVAHTNSDECVSVGIADYAVTSDGRPLKTSGLGSCVAVVIHDATVPVSGLLHFMLPDSAARNKADSDAKFADTGLEVLLEEFRRCGGHPSRSWAVLAGGATMLEFNSVDRSIGDQNVAAARGLLEAVEIPIRESTVGGSSGRTITVDPSAGTVAVRSPDGTVVLE